MITLSAGMDEPFTEGPDTWTGRNYAQDLEVVRALGGDDVLNGKAEVDHLYGDGGEDTIYGGGGADLIWGGSENDVINGGPDTVGYWWFRYTGSGLIPIYPRPESGWQYDADHVVRDGNDTLWGEGGDDDIAGYFGDDTIFGGEGDDNLLNGQSGNDTIFGDAGNDTIVGEAGVDYVYGGIGNDYIEGGAGIDWLNGQEGSDEVYGDDGNDVLLGEDGVDYLYGGVNDDYISGGNGNDENLNGQHGDDIIDGDNGNDRIFGEAGKDELNGKQGADFLYGGSEDDIFDYDDISDSTPAARDVIYEFSGVGGPARTEYIDISKVDADSFLPGNQGFTFIGSADFSTPGQVRAVAASGTSDTLVQANVTGSYGAEFEILVIDGAALPEQWTAYDFLL